MSVQGQFDSSRPTKYHDRLKTTDGTATGADLKNAIQLALEGRDVPLPWKYAIGCNVKWTPGNEPAYFGGKA